MTPLYKSNPLPAVVTHVSILLLRSQPGQLISMLTKFYTHEEWHCFITCKRCNVYVV